MKPPPPPLDIDHWRRIEPLLDQALDLPPEERSAFLDSACADDPRLRADVEALLAADEGAGDFLGTPAGEYAPDLFEEEDDEAAKEDLAGRTVGPYRLLREIGSGGMGTVYEAEDTRLRRRVAVKLLPPEYSREAQAKERFLREARAASAVDHPNLCTVHDVGESEGRLYIVFALYDGETLRERIRRGPLPPAEARDVALQVARGLARAHEAGIVHRDVKPANVMLPRRGEAKILDFGIARLEEEDALTRTGAAWGTPAYMSPEQARGEPVDARADVWSLGVMLYEMVAGRRPSGSEGARDPEPLERLRPDVPPELARVTARALARDPAERYPSAVELLADLESGATPAPLPQPRRRAGNKALWLGILAMAVLAVLVLFFRDRFGAVPTLRVAILRPVVQGRSNPPFVASEVRDAALSTLLSLQGIQPLDPLGQTPETLSSNEADEVLLPLLTCQDDWCKVTLRRLREPGGVVLGKAGPFEIPAKVESSYQLEEGMRAKLLQLYPGHPPRPDSPGGTVRPEDHSAYIRLARRQDSGQRLGNAELDRLDALLRTSPGLFGACLLAAGAARDQGDYDRALDYAARAERLAPYDPRPLFHRFRTEIAAKRFDEAEATLARLTQTAPSDVRVRQAEADLLEDRDEDLEKALGLRQEIVRRRPTWRTILDLATLEIRLGHRESARRRLDSLLKQQPDNRYVQENLAVLEVLVGDPKRAETLYRKLLGSDPEPRYLTNLGWIRLLLGDYAEAAAISRRALDLKPGHLRTRFNLASALEGQGDLAGARRLYRDLEPELAAASPPLDAETRMLHAQCLAHLDRKEEAIRVADAALKQRPDDVQLLNSAAQVYALTGDDVTAFYYTELALKKGMRPEWFTLPEFRALQKDSRFQALLDRYRPRKSES